jgi:hypothetical protein
MSPTSDREQHDSVLHLLLDRSWDSRERCCGRDPVCRVLRQEVKRVGREFEALPYERLLKPASLSFSRTVDGTEIFFAAEAFQIDRNGDLHFWIDARARGCAPTWQPSYRFVKRKDGSIYY